MTTSSTVQHFKRTIKVGGYRATVTAILVNDKIIDLQTVWDPNQPRFDKRLLDQYDRKRNKAYTALAKKIGVPVVIIGDSGAVGIFPDGRQEVIYTNH